MIEDNKKGILMICYVFPPLAYAGTHRSIRLCKHLNRLGYDISVITIDIKRKLQNDDGLLSKVRGTCEIYRTKTIDPLHMYRPLKKKLLKTNLGRVLDKAGSIVVKYLSLPDHMVYWVPFAYFKARRLLKDKNPSIVYTSSPPHSEHLVGFLLKKRFRKIWIADLRDPIMDNVSAKNFGFVEKIINSKLERLIIKNADAVITNSNSAQRSLEKKYDTKSVKTIYNAFDEEDFNSTKIDKFSHYTIAHIGSIYGTRKVDILFESIKDLHINGMISPNRFKVLFTGINDNFLRKAIKTYGIEDYIEIRDSVPHFEALKLMRSAHLLLLVKNFGKNSENHIPGKLFEYIGSGNKILYIGPDNNEVVDIIKSHGLGYIIDGSQADLGDFLLNELAIVNVNDSLEENKKERLFQEFSSQTMAKQFDQVITKILNQ